MIQLPRGVVPQRRPGWHFYDQVSDQYPPFITDEGRLEMSKGDREAAGFFVEHLAKCKRVLDLGCGSGLPSLVVAPHVGCVLGVDRAPRMVALARSRAARLNLVNVEFLVAAVRRWHLRWR